TLQTAAGDKTVSESLTLELAETFKSEHRFAGNAFCGHCARHDGPAVDDHGAASALTRRTAAILRRYDSTAITQEFQQRHAVFDLDGAVGRIQVELDRVSHQPGP